MKKWLSILLVFALLMPAGVLSAAANDPIKVFVDGKQLKFDVDPIMANNTTLVQYTTVFKALGMDYSWDQKSKTVTGYNDYVLMNLTIGSRVSTINNKKIELAVPARTLNGRTLVPLRFISEATGAKVVWDGKKRTVTITSAPERTELPLVMRETKWNDTAATVSSLETATLYSKSEDYLAYEAVDLGGYATFPTYYFDNDKLFMIEYDVAVEAESNYDYLVAIGTLYNAVEELFGEPFHDELYFYDANDYHEDVNRFADSIAAGKAELTTAWQVGYTEISITAFSDDEGGIVVLLTLLNTKE